MATNVQEVRDSDVCQAVLRRLRQTPETAAADIGVTAANGVVTLMGVVARKAEKEAAETAAKEIKGVSIVADSLEVRPVPERSETEIAKDLMRALHGNICIPADRIKATVADGVVTLEGLVSSDFERLTAEAAARRLCGITGVSNKIIVGSAPIRQRGDDVEAQDESSAIYAEIGEAADA
jgi:osmotically-inducible protein OsmY